jgi:hypothetical protein
MWGGMARVWKVVKTMPRSVILLGIVLQLALGLLVFLGSGD